MEISKNETIKSEITENKITEKEAPRYTMREEIINSITHGIGIILAIAGLAILTAFSAKYGTVWHIVSSAIYGATLIATYSASTLYHSVTHREVKAVFQSIDHASIYVLIAGTYTPFTLVPLREVGAWGWSLFWAIWGLTILGLILQAVQLKHSKAVRVVLSMLMGWVAAIAIKPMLGIVPDFSLVLLLVGGFFYSVGVIFYLGKKIPYHHAIWHIFVLLGSLCHFCAIFVALFFPHF